MTFTGHFKGLAFQVNPYGYQYPHSVADIRRICPEIVDLIPHFKSGL
jgi:hypothetical protein